MIYHAHGKLLLTGEYFVLDGALALALPTKLGQSLQVVKNHSGEISWKSYDADGSVWFEDAFELNPMGFAQKYKTGVASAPSQRMLQLFQAIEKQKPVFFEQFQGLQVETRLEFPREWGLGSSSTLIANLATWAGIDPFQLLRDTFGGSGYDIACANANGPIVYQLENSTPKFEPAVFQFPFANQLYFIYLGKKQDSRKGIAQYREKAQQQALLTKSISSLTLLFLECKNLADFEDLIRRHEAIVASTLNLPRAKDLYFADFWGEVKSLGAWGGDFVLATSDRPAEETKFYFNEKGFAVVLPYDTIIL